jgi:putative glycosyl hydrolase
MAGESAEQALPKVNRFGLNVHHYEFQPEAFPLVAEARVGWVRLAAWWRFMERQRGQIDFGYLDPSVEAALAHGLKVLIVFVSIPAWANGTPPELGIIDKNAALPPTDPQFFRDFVTAVVTRYRGRVGHYEIWNEPNYKEFWNGDYGTFIDEILISGAQAVKAADPAALTMGPATDRSRAKFETAARKACNFLDILSCHLYMGSTSKLFKEADTHYLPILQQQCNKPLWVTEFGIDSWEEGMSEDVQAKELAAALDGLRQRAYLQRLFLFEWRDGYWPAKGQKGWGLVSNSIEGLRRKKSFWAVQDLALRWLRQPGVARSPQPADGATQVPLTAPLTWKAGRGARSHRISVGTESPTFQREQTETTFPASAAAPREPGRTYLWRVDEVKDGKTTRGSLWRFTTEDPAAAGAPVIVRVQQPSPFFLGVTEGQGRAECAPMRSLVLPNTTPETAQGAWTVRTGPADLNFLLPAGQSVPDALTISVSGLRPGTTYRVFGRFATTPQLAARQAAVRMGLDPASMTLYRADSPGATLVRKLGRWEEREVEIGSARADGGSLQVLLDAQGAEERAGWTGLRLETETA